MAVAVYDRGDELVVSAAVRNTADTLTNPTTITFYAKAPDGTVTPYLYGTASEVTTSGTGLFDFVFTPNAAGDWVFVVRSVGNGVNQVDKTRIEVEATGIPAIDT